MRHQLITAAVVTSLAALTATAFTSGPPTVRPPVAAPMEPASQPAAQGRQAVQLARQEALVLQEAQGAANAVAAIAWQQQQAAAQAAAAKAAAARAAEISQAAAGVGSYAYLITTAYQACVIRAESGGNWMIWNPSGHWGWYQFAYGTWTGNGGPPADFGTAGPAEQTQIFWNTFRADGTQPWVSDGC